METVLILSFGPFGGRGVNGSSTLASRLNNVVIDANYECAAHELPVAWGVPEREIPKLIETYNPVVAIGIGEGCRGFIDLELRGANKTCQIADINQDMPPYDFLIKDGPPVLFSDLPIDGHTLSEMNDMCPVDFRISFNAESYLCNAMIYCGLLFNSGKFNFIHVPPQGNRKNEEYAGQYFDFIRFCIEKIVGLHRRRVARK